MDGDGQHDPAYLENIVKPVAEGRLDMCIGSRFITKEALPDQLHAPRRHSCFERDDLFCSAASGVKDVTSGFRATNARMTAYFAKHYAADYPEPEAILAACLAGFRVGEAAVVMQERHGARVQHQRGQERVLHGQGLTFAGH